MLPRSVQDIADVIGVEKTLFMIGKLPRCYNGSQFHTILYVPSLARLTVNHFLVGIIGYPATQKLSYHFGGEILHPAPCASLYRGYRDDNIRRLLLEGVPVPMLAEWFDLSDRHIKNLAREMPELKARKAVIPQQEKSPKSAQNARQTNPTGTTRAKRKKLN